MAQITNLTSLLLFATSALVAVAAPARPDITTKETTPTRAAMTSACTNGLAASKQHPAGYPINDYTLVTPAANNWTSYTIEQDWYGNHFVSGPHVGFAYTKRFGLMGSNGWVADNKNRRS